MNSVERRLSWHQHWLERDTVTLARNCFAFFECSTLLAFAWAPKLNRLVLAEDANATILSCAPFTRSTSFPLQCYCYDYSILASQNLPGLELDGLLVLLAVMSTSMAVYREQG